MIAWWVGKKSASKQEMIVKANEETCLFLANYPNCVQEKPHRKWSRVMPTNHEWQLSTSKHDAHKSNDLHLERILVCGARLMMPDCGQLKRRTHKTQLIKRCVVVNERNKNQPNPGGFEQKQRRLSFERWERSRVIVTTDPTIRWYEKWQVGIVQCKLAF